MNFTITWRDETLCEVYGDIRSIKALANILENRGIEFYISNSYGRLSPKTFGFGDYKYWLPIGKNILD